MAANVGTSTKEKEFLVDVGVWCTQRHGADAHVAVWNLGLVEQMSAKSGEGSHHCGGEAKTLNRGRLVVLLRVGEVAAERSATGRWVFKRCGSGRRKRALKMGPCKMMSYSISRHPAIHYSH